MATTTVAARLGRLVSKQGRALATQRLGPALEQRASLLRGSAPALSARSVLLPATPRLALPSTVNPAIHLPSVQLSKKVSLEGED